MEQMRERVARARDALNNQKQCDEDGVMCIVSRQALHEVLAHYDALSLMQPEIDRRVAEEKAKLLAGLRNTVADHLEACVNDTIQDVAELPDRDSPDDWPEAMLVTGEELAIILERNVQAMLAQYEKEEQL